MSVSSRNKSVSAAVAFLAAAFAILLVSPARFSPWLFLAFLACFVTGSLFALGLLMWPWQADRRPGITAPKRRPNVAVQFAPPRLPTPVVVFVSTIAAAFAVAWHADRRRSPAISRRLRR